MEVLLVVILLAVVAYFVLRHKSTSRQQIPLDHLPETFAVVDLETTGLDAGRHEIIEIAAIRYRKGSTSHDTYQSLVKPKRKVPKKITKITGITQDMIEQEGKQLAEVLREFTDFIGTQRLVTFNAEFDMAFLDVAWETNGLPKPNNPVSCALKMARRAWPGRKSYRLNDLAADGDIASGQAHRALEDARRALLIYAAATPQLKSPV